MGLIAKKDFLEWINKQLKKGNWLQVNEVPSMNGRQITYLTSSGQFIVAVYNIKGELEQVGQPVAMPQPTPGGLPRGFGRG